MGQNDLLQNDFLGDGEVNFTMKHEDHEVEGAVSGGFRTGLTGWERQGRIE